VTLQAAMQLGERGRPIWILVTASVLLWSHCNRYPALHCHGSWTERDPKRGVFGGLPAADHPQRRAPETPQSPRAWRPTATAIGAFSASPRTTPGFPTARLHGDDRGGVRGAARCGGGAAQRTAREARHNQE